MDALYISEISQNDVTTNNVFGTAWSLNGSHWYPSPPSVFLKLLTTAAKQTPAAKETIVAKGRFSYFGQWLGIAASFWEGKRVGVNSLHVIY